MLSVRALIAHFCCAAIACLLGMEIPTALGLANASPKPRETGSGRTLSEAERVAYQYAIEEIYWRHRIWPRDNPRPKPPLDAVISREQIEKKVTDYLRKSQLVTNQRGWPITASELQAEMDRMAKHTKQPKMLRELFAALGNDPFVMAECLARLALTERLVTNAHLAVADRWSHGEPERRYRVLNTIAAPSATYMLPQVLQGAGGCTDDTWTPTTTVNVPDARFRHTAVWTGSEMIVWGGSFTTNVWHYFNTGGRYDPATDTWTPTNTINAPTARDAHTAVWTGSEMIVWGGSPAGSPPYDTGGRYQPAADRWRATSIINAPIAWDENTAVWTGSEMIAWGGINGTDCVNTGGRYCAQPPTPPITVIQPNGGEVWTAGSVRQIKWNRNLRHSDHLIIQYSRDGGANWFRIAQDIPAFTFGYWWQVDNFSTTQGRVKILLQEDRSIADESDANFTVQRRP